MAETSEQLAKRMDKERASIEAGILAVHAAFAKFEGACAILLHNAIASPNPHMGLHIYFSPNATETRVGIVDAIVNLVLRDHPEKSRVLAVWKRVYNRIGRARKVRNQIIHGEINKAFIGGRWCFRLTPILQDSARYQEHLDRQQVGLSSNEIRKNATQFYAIRAEILTLSSLVSEFLNGRHGTSLEILQSLESHPPG